jgi:hypothetical protein
MPSSKEDDNVTSVSLKVEEFLDELTKSSLHGDLDYAVS